MRVNWIQLVCTAPTSEGAEHGRLDVRRGELVVASAPPVLRQLHQAVAVQDAFESKRLRPVFHFTAFHSTDSRVETRRFQAMGHSWIQRVQPHQVPVPAHAPHLDHVIHGT
jgi:hypothetical protein